MPIVTTIRHSSFSLFNKPEWDRKSPRPESTCVERWGREGTRIACSVLVRNGHCRGWWSYVFIVDLWLTVLGNTCRHGCHSLSKVTWLIVSGWTIPGKRQAAPCRKIRHSLMTPSALRVESTPHQKDYVLPCSRPRKRCTSSWSTVTRARWRRCRGWGCRSMSSGCTPSRSRLPSTSSMIMASCTETSKVHPTWLPRAVSWCLLLCPPVTSGGSTFALSQEMAASPGVHAWVGSSRCQLRRLLQRYCFPGDEVCCCFRLRGVAQSVLATPLGQSSLA